MTVAAHSTVDKPPPEQQQQQQQHAMSAGVKRDRDGTARARGRQQHHPNHQSAPPGRFDAMFSTFRDELDEHHDRRERIIKASRDVTAQSKKIIFALQRLKHLNQPLPAPTEQDISSRLGEITTQLEAIAPDLASVNRHRYARSLRCLEELIEALSFQHYLRHQRLITPAETQALVPGGIPLTAHDYLYGVFDLFGELMRFATVTTAQHGALLGGEGEGEAGGERRTILCDIQALGCAFELLRAIPTRDYRGKMDAARQSVKKVEKLGYGLVVRGSERPKGWVPDMKDDDEGPASP